MRTVILSSLLIVMLFTTNLVWAENLPPSTSLGVEALQTEYSQKLPDGTTVVYGEVKNNLGSPVNSVSVAILFMDDNNNQIEYKVGTTLVSVIPPGGKAPFVISSTKADPSITHYQVKIAGFKSSSSKNQVLEISSISLQASDKLAISGTVTNNGGQKSLNTKLYLILYDPFQRIVDIGISNPIDIDASKNSQFSVTSDLNPKATSYVVIAESDTYESKPTGSDLHVLPVTVANTAVTDSNGTSYSTIPINSTVLISSKASHILGSTQPFIYYVQIKQFSGQTQFIGKYEGIFLGLEDKNVTVNWIPHSPGSYYVETYVWDYDNVPLSSAEPSIVVALVK